MAGKIIGIISIKGGVGKTTTVSNLGAILAKDFGKKVLVVDANYSAPNLGLHFGLVNPKITLHHVLRDTHKVSKAIYEHEKFPELHVLPASLMPRKKINPYKLRNRIDELKDYYDFILIDSSPTLNEEMLSTIIASDELLVVTSPDFPTLSCTMRAVKTAKQRKTPIAGLVMNKVRNKRFELSINEVEDAAQAPVLAVVPDDVRLLEALAAANPATAHAPMSNAVVEYKKLAACLVGEDFKDKRFKTRVKSFFSSEIRKDEANRAILREKY